ncbi:MAG: hypothetical protein FWD61_15755 [Phycisphaerales bacterium]|nr:hypothetical protein [Phycisphaerales bacterium]
MDFAKDEEKAVLSKSLAIIKKAINDLTQLDHWQFPTPASNSAKKLLIRSLEELKKPENCKIVDPAVLYNRVLELRELVEEVSMSSTDRIA